MSKVKYFSILLIIVHFFCMHSLKAGSCRRFERQTLYLDLINKSVKNKSKAHFIEEFCGLPKSGQENVLLEVKDGKKVLFSREIFLNLDYFFDASDDSKKNIGGRIVASDVTVVTHIPLELLNMKELSIVFSRLSDSMVLVRGKL